MRKASLLLVLAIFAAPVAARAGERTESYDAEVAVRWLEVLYDVVKNEATSPPPASRIYGIASVALYEAVVPGSSEHRSLAGQLNDLRRLPRAGAARHHWPSVANAALARVVRGLFPAARPGSRALVDGLEEELADRYASEDRHGVIVRSRLLGRRLGQAILDWAAGDGLDVWNQCPFEPPVGPGLWEPTPPAFAPPLQPCWDRIRPMVLASSEECAPPPPPVYSTDPASELYELAFEVYQTRQTLTQEQIDVASYWADGPGATGTPPGHSISIVSGLVVEDGMDLMRAAEAYARVGIAVHDAFIGCWNAKYTHHLLRPITYIRDVIDPAWSPLLVTPNFPEHTSGHSTQSGAAAAVLTDLLGVRSFTDTTHGRHGLAPPLADRSFSSFDQAAEEAAVSRLYGGIHFRSGNDAGLSQGRCIGRTIVERVEFRK